MRRFNIEDGSLVELQIGTKVNIDGEDCSVFEIDGKSVGLEGDDGYFFVDGRWLHSQMVKNSKNEYSEDDISELFELDNENKEQDVINNPSHYTFGKYECLDVAKEIVKDMSGEESIMFFNAFKYLWRHKHKNGLQDLKKCEFYLKELIKLNEQNE